MADQLNQGRAGKGDFTHWHHDRFKATELNLAAYLTPPYDDAVTGKKVFPAAPSGLQRLESSGDPIDPNGVMARTHRKYY
jgi:hypothetical protein